MMNEQLPSRKKQESEERNFSEEVQELPKLRVSTRPPATGSTATGSTLSSSTLSSSTATGSTLSDSALSEFGEHSKGDTNATAQAEGKAKIRTDSLRAFFGTSEVIKGISMTFPEKRVTAIIGPSGCGKSTYIRCLNRMHEVAFGARSEGRVLLDGMDIYDGVDPVRVRRRVGMVFQKPNPFPTMSIRDNVLAGLRLNGIRTKNADELVEKSLRAVALFDEVKDGLHRSGMSLSGGQQQRLCIARTLAMEPEVILMDEPCSALDPIATARIEELIHELRNSYTIAIVTHNMQQAARVADYTALFYMGELVERDETHVIFTRPSQQQTEDYITGRFG